MLQEKLIVLIFKFIKSLFRKLDLFGLTVGTILFLLLISYTAGFWKIIKANSHSTVDGYYLVIFTNQLPIVLDNYVVVCIPTKKHATFALTHGLLTSNRYCINHTAPLIKTVKALAGDIVIENPLGVQVNGNLIPYSAPLILSNLTAYNTTGKLLKKDELFVMGDNPRSFDSRYFGIVDKTFIIGKAYLIWKI